MPDWFNFGSGAASILGFLLNLATMRYENQKARAEICAVLWRRIVEHPAISIRDIRLVVNTKVGGLSLLVRPIAVGHVVGDLYSEALTNPLLDPARRNQILRALDDLAASLESDPSAWRRWLSWPAQQPSSTIFLVALVVAFAVSLIGAPRIPPSFGIPEGTQDVVVGLLVGALACLSAAALSFGLGTWWAAREGAHPLGHRRPPR